MRQNINLYIDERKNNRVWLSLYHFVAVVFCFIFLLAIYSFFVYREYRLVNSNHQDLAVYLDGENSQKFDYLLNKILEKKESVARDIQRVSADIDRKKTWLKFYHKNVRGDLAGLNDFFADVGQLSKGKLSISEFVVDKSGGKVVLVGFAKNKSDIPLHLRSIFSGKLKVDLLKIEYVGDRGVYRFKAYITRQEFMSG